MNITIAGLENNHSDIIHFEVPVLSVLGCYLSAFHRQTVNVLSTPPHVAAGGECTHILSFGDKTIIPNTPSKVKKKKSIMKIQKVIILWSVPSAF